MERRAKSVRASGSDERNVFTPQIPPLAIVAALGVTRATVSGLMAALERDGLVKSAVGRHDRRNLKRRRERLRY